MEVINGVPADPGSEALVEPELHVSISKHECSLCATYLIPPVHGDQVTEPLMGKLVSDNVDNAVLVLLIRGVLVIKHGSGSSEDSALVLLLACFTTYL